MGVRFPGEVSSVKTTGSLPLRSLYFRDKQQNKQLYEMLLGKKKIQHEEGMQKVRVSG